MLSKACNQLKLHVEICEIQFAPPPSSAEGLMWSLIGFAIPSTSKLSLSAPTSSSVSMLVVVYWDSTALIHFRTRNRRIELCSERTMWPAPWQLESFVPRARGDRFSKSSVGTKNSKALCIFFNLFLLSCVLAAGVCNTEVNSWYH